MLKTFLPALLFFLLDRIIKNFSFGTGLATLNRGIAFGSFPRFSLVLTGIGFLFLVIFWFLTSLRVHPKQSRSDCRVSAGWRILAMTQQSGFFLILFGGFSNLLDRLVYNGVVDYIHISNFLPSFNLGDVMIVGGVGMLIYRGLGKIDDGE